MTLIIYGTARSRALRTLWMAHELNILFQHEDVGYGPDGCRSPTFLAINPNGHIPAISDDGVVMWESLAINLYLARKYGGPLAPADIGEEGRMLSWTLWAASELEPHAAQAMYHTHLYSPDQRDPALAAQALEKVSAPLTVLEAELAKGGGFLVGGRFTAADLNVIACVFYLRFTPSVLAEHHHLRAWYAAGMARPAAMTAFSLRGEVPQPI